MQAHMQHDYMKAIKYANLLVSKATAYRDKHGYRENLGYDSQRKLESMMTCTCLSYSVKHDVMCYFIHECDNI